MIAKIKLTLEQDEQRGTNEGMQETIELLAALDTLPIQQIVVTLECEEVIAENYREKLRLGVELVTAPRAGDENLGVFEEDGA